MTGPIRRWQPDTLSAAILTAYARRRQNWRDVLQRALRALARADGILDNQDRIITEPGHRRRP
ncbi:hypothetical protein ABZZ74_23510 [Streptomyces sp. NPDC006476]|uniref:hypothetical protein n=1 Tax=Streptomyces sp. NPDC006476 TaxID=3157175 RepID=UPI0033B4D8CE